MDEDTGASADRRGGSDPAPGAAPQGERARRPDVTACLGGGGSGEPPVGRGRVTLVVLADGPCPSGRLSLSIDMQAVRRAVRALAAESDEGVCLVVTPECSMPQMLGIFLDGRRDPPLVRVAPRRESLVEMAAARAPDAVVVLGGHETTLFLAETILHLAPAALQAPFRSTGGAAHAMFERAPELAETAWAVQDSYAAAFRRLLLALRAQ